MSSDTLSAVKGLSDQELREKLTGLGMDVGPITGTTRTLYERKLVQLLTGSLPEFGGDASPTPPKSPPKSPRKPSPRKPVDEGHYGAAPDHDTADGYTMGEVNASVRQPLESSTINLIRARKPVSRAVIEEPFSRQSIPRQSSPFPAANAQFRKAEPGSGGSTMDHVLKFALFGIVMLVIIYFITNQEPGKSLEHRT
ncbi:ankyrin repeat and LEM domain-containing protein 2-like [Thrips palmi]|uniref:Ankyrin repeat and LEM domain-containing protein 2-like n=1 Tax=Thrips palmi TaxID=161013 RepID=A0A6P8YLA6_THRPL|nr:ankyrin repeat and LEM domain-containing protein 2-like [Thrips palmi]